MTSLMTQELSLQRLAAAPAEPGRRQSITEGHRCGIGSTHGGGPSGGVWDGCAHGCRVLSAVGAAVPVTGTGVGVGAAAATVDAVLMTTTGVGVSVGAVGVTGVAVGIMAGVAVGVLATGPTVLGWRGPGVGCRECGAAAWCGAD